MMTRWKRWWEHRRSQAGASAGIGVIGGIILFVTVLTAGIGAVQAARVHHALYQAAQKASQIEQQQGCWTNGASTAVYNTLKAAGLNPNTVKVTADTASTQDYGQAVTAGLQTHVDFHVLGLNLVTLPIGATVNGASFYTPSAAGGTNAACVTPAICTGASGDTFVGCTGTGVGTYNVYACGTVTSSYVGTAPSGQCAATSHSSTPPKITNVSFSGSGQNLRMVITGQGFGSAPQSMPYAGDTSAFLFYDQTQNWSGGNTGNAVTVNYSSWSSSQIVIAGFAANYGGGWVDHGGDSVQLTVWNHGQKATWSGSLPTTTITVSSVSASGSTVTVTGNNLPALTGATSATNGTNYGNFLWSMGSTPTQTAVEANGNTRYPYTTDWGIHVLHSSSTELQFDPANSPAGMTWYLYLVPASGRIHSTTSYVWSGTP